MNKLTKFVTSHLTAQQNQNIANLLMGAGVAVSLIDMVVNGMTLRLVPVIVAVGLAGIGYAYQLLFVRCSHCGDKLKGLKAKAKLPDRCPECNGRLDRLPKKTEE